VLPIKNAHLGIAMGEGSRASKTVSSLVLETNNFDLLPEALEEGRTILRNVRRAAKIFLVKNVYTLLLIVGTLGVFRLPFPYLPQQVTLLNFLTIGIPAFFIMLSRERSAAAVSHTRFLREVGGFALRTGVVIGLAGLTLMALYDRSLASAASALERAAHVRTLRTLLLSALVLLGLMTLLRALTDGETRPLPGDRKFRWWAAAAILIYLAAMYWRPAAYFFDLMSLTTGQWAWVLATVIPASALLWIRGLPR
jgi:cation-transporting ATPase E